MNVPPRSDSFYRFAVLAGMALALFALAWGRWTLGQSRERLFALGEQQVHARAAAESQREEVERIDAYAATIDRTVSAEQARSAARTALLARVSARTGFRRQRARIELDRRQSLVVSKARQEALIGSQMGIDASRSDGVAALGLTMTVTGLLLWYVRRQRHLDAALRSVKPLPIDGTAQTLYEWDEAAVLADGRRERDEPISMTGGK